MPGLARLDAPGVLHHVIGRGIEKKNIFLNNKDRNDKNYVIEFVNRATYHQGRSLIWRVKYNSYARSARTSPFTLNNQYVFG